MAQRKKPPFRGDHVGSLLRPEELLESRTKMKAGQISAEELRNHENECIREVIKLQENAGLMSITDGEFRRESFHVDFIGQIKNVFQEKDPEQNIKKKNQQTQAIKINSFDNLLEICNLKKEVKLKYELEKNVNLVSFKNQRIEISFNDDLGKEFIKILSSKLYEWTGNRWIITLSKKKGKPSIKENEVNLKKDLLEKIKKRTVYKNILEIFPDAELNDIEIEEKSND